jgi:putative GTP pyrophosphokinase
MDVETIKKDYARKSPILRQLREEAEFILLNAIKSNKIKIHNILSRVKELDSFLKKIERKESNTSSEEIVDLVGLRVVCLFRSDIPLIGNIIRSEFSIISEDDRIEGSEVSSFGYQSVHFVVKIKSDYSGPRYNLIKDIPFEIQVRTVAMDAWAIISHYLDYKTDKDVPLTIRKDFYALSGLFYVVDTHFELFYHSSIENRESTERRIINGISPSEELNIDTFRAYVKSKIKEHEIPKSDVSGYSEIVNELLSAGYKTIKDIDIAVDRGWHAFIEYENHYPPHSKVGSKYNAIGVVRGLMTIVDENFYKHRKVKPTKLDEYQKYRHLVKAASS